jgi:thymidylate synthase
MNVYHFPRGESSGTYAMLVSDVLEQKPIHTGEWQAMNTSGSPAHSTHELEDVSLVWESTPKTIEGLYTMVPAIDKSWASEHFEERVSGQPLNPAPSHVRWPYAVRGNADHTTDQVFDHTYPERFWPQFANEGQTRPNGRQVFVPHNGIRFHYGDLDNVVSLLVRSPLTRQAYLPVWFPEDTGAVDGQRVPCTLGYHFMQRGGRLSVRYYLRSCDVYRHLSNDVFFMAALLHWVCNQVNAATEVDEAPLNFTPGKAVMHISSLHAFVGDRSKIIDRVNKL